MNRLPITLQQEDLVQSGMIGLLEAAKNFDVDKGASFETYASIRVRGAMLDEIRKNDWAPRSVHRNTRRILRAVQLIEHQEGRDAKDSEVAKNLQVTLSEYHRMVQDTFSVKIHGIEEFGVGEDIVTGHLPQTFIGPLDGLQKEHFKKCLFDSIKMLPEKERKVIELYYQEELNLREVGQILGVSESRISQIHTQAMLRLQNKLKDWGP